jgi:hypothetical protein
MSIFALTIVCALYAVDAYNSNCLTKKKHFLCAAIYNGYPTFLISIIFIGLCTAVIGDIAGHLGCFIYLKDTVNAIAFVALGTSVPGISMNTFFYMSLV